MAEEKHNNKIFLDLDRDRIKTILGEAYKISHDYLQTDFEVSLEDFVASINPYLDSNRVSVPIQLSLNSKKYPGMLIEVDLRQKKVFARVHPKVVQAMLNHMLKGL
jgi:hypothetical protein